MAIRIITQKEICNVAGGQCGCNHDVSGKHPNSFESLKGCSAFFDDVDTKGGCINKCCFESNLFTQWHWWSTNEQGEEVYEHGLCRDYIKPKNTTSTIEKNMKYLYTGSTK